MYCTIQITGVVDQTRTSIPVKRFAFFDGREKPFAGSSYPKCLWAVFAACYAFRVSFLLWVDLQKVLNNGKRLLMLHTLKIRPGSALQRWLSTNSWTRLKSPNYLWVHSLTMAGRVRFPLGVQNGGHGSGTHLSSTFINIWVPEDCMFIRVGLSFFNECRKLTNADQSPLQPMVAAIHFEKVIGGNPHHIT